MRHEGSGWKWRASQRALPTETCRLPRRGLVLPACLLMMSGRWTERRTIMSDHGTACSYRARRAVIERLAPSYQHASCVQKGVILNAVVATTGYTRKYAIPLLNQTSAAGHHRMRRPRLPRYGAEVQEALVQVWKAARCICAKRLIPFVPRLVAS